MRTRLETFKQNARVALVFALCMVAFTVIAMSAGERDTYWQLLSSAAQPETSEVSAQANVAKYSKRSVVNKKSIADIRGDLYRQLQSGTRTSTEIQGEIAQMAGDSGGVEFTSENINRAYKLSIVMSHYKNMLSNPYEVLFVHTLAGEGQPEDTVTFYTRKLDGAEERNTRGQLAFSRLIDMDDKGQPHFASASRLNYKFDLQDHPIKRTFDLRVPEGEYQISDVPAESFDPLSILTSKESPFDYGLYHQEISHSGKTYDVQVSVRSTELETLTIEVRLQEMRSLVTQTYILVYEEL